MKTWQKVGIGVGAAVVLGGIVLFSVNQANKGVVTVQTAKVAPQEALVSQVTASGEIKPTTYTNVTAQGFGRITEILVKEGQHVKAAFLVQESDYAVPRLKRRPGAVPFLAQKHDARVENTCRILYDHSFSRGLGDVAWVDEQRNRGGWGHQVAHQLKAFCDQLHV